MDTKVWCTQLRVVSTSDTCDLLIHWCSHWANVPFIWNMILSLIVDNWVRMCYMCAFAKIIINFSHSPWNWNVIFSMKFNKLLLTTLKGSKKFSQLKPPSLLLIWTQFSNLSLMISPTASSLYPLKPTSNMMWFPMPLSAWKEIWRISTNELFN